MMVTPHGKLKPNDNTTRRSLMGEGKWPPNTIGLTIIIKERIQYQADQSTHL